MFLIRDYSVLKKEYESEKKIISQLREEDLHNAVEYALMLISELFSEKKFQWVVDLYRSNIFKDKSLISSFEAAYSLKEAGFIDEAELAYRNYIMVHPQSSNAMNNLHIILKNKGKKSEAWELIQTAISISPDDEIIESNFSKMADELQEEEAQKAIFKAAVARVKNENDFVVQKLSNFISGAKKDTAYKDGIIAIPKWKLKVLMKTDDEKASSLIKQWHEKGYVVKTGNRGSYKELEYQINPHIIKALRSSKPLKVPENWVTSIDSINGSHLSELGYFKCTAKLKRVKKSFKSSISRDLDELFLNYVFKNSKSVIVMSGSLVELLLIYHLDKNKVTFVEYNINGKSVKRKLLDSTLFDLLNYCEEKNTLTNITVHLGNVSRLYRNFVHPGKEIKDKSTLDFNKANLCFSTTMEIYHSIL